MLTTFCVSQTVLNFPFVYDCRFVLRCPHSSDCDRVNRLKFDNDVIIKLGRVARLGNGPSLRGHNRRNGSNIKQNGSRKQKESSIRFEKRRTSSTSNRGMQYGK